MTEDQLQMMVAKYLDIMGWTWCHVANERKTSPRAGGKLKAKGVKKGVPDCLIFENWLEENRDVMPGIAIELKSAKGRLTTEQSDWLKALSERGWKTAVCRSLQEVIDVCSVLNRT